MTDICADKKQNETAQILMEENPAGILVYDKTGRIISANQAIVKLSGMRREEMIGNTSAIFNIISQTGEGIKEAIQYRKKCQGKVIIKFIQDTKIFDITAIPILDETQEIHEIILILTDLTEQERMAEEIRNKVAWYQSILDAVQFPIHVTDMDMKWTYMNKAFEAVLLKNNVIKDRESAYGLPCHTADATICRTENCGIHQLRTKGVMESYFKWQGMNGKQVTKPVMNAKGEQIGFVETVQDLTDILSVQEYTKKEIDRIGENLNRMANGNLNFNLEIYQPDQYTTAQYEAFSAMNEQLRKVHDSYAAVISDIETVTKALVRGNLNVRADMGKHKGDNLKVIEGLNATVDAMADKVAWYQSILDAVQFPIHVTDMDMKWTYMNKAFEAVLLKNKVINDRESAYGLPCHTADATICRTENCGIHQLRTKGVMESYFEWQGMNGKQVTKPVMNAKGEQIGFVETVQDLTEHLSLINYLNTEVARLSSNIEKLSNGDFNLNMAISKSDNYSEKAKSAFEIINRNIENLLEKLTLLTDDTVHLSKQAILGDLSTRIDVNRHNGEFMNIVKGINDTLDSVMEPVNESMRLCSSYANYTFADRFNTSIKIEGDWIAFRNALNNIGIQVSGAVTLIHQKIANLATSVEEANASVEEISAGAQQIARNANKMNQNAEHGGEGINQVLRAMEDLNETVGAVSRKAESVSVASDQANSFAKEGIDLARQSEEAMGEITRSADEVETIVTGINHQMDEIGKIVRLISDIASQTNLLALNAAIEAARAGEAGRGFAVVAAEVKSLAQDSRQSAENITDMISNLQNKTKMASEAMEKSTVAVKDGGKSLEQTLGAFNQIATTIEEINQNILEVASASEEQAASVQEVTASIQEVSNMIQDTASESGDSAAATEEATASLEEISKIMNSLVNIVDSISQEMKKFTVTS